MKADAYLTDYKALRTFPLDLGNVLRTYGLTTQKSMLSKFTIKTKILPIMQRKADKNLTIPTLYFMLEAAREVVSDLSQTYIPIIGKEEILLCFATGISHFPVETSPEVMRDLIAMVKEIVSVLDSVTNKGVKEFAKDCSDAFSEVASYLEDQEEVAIGYALTARNDDATIPVANAYMSNLSDHPMEIGKNDDLRQIVFVNPFGESGMAMVDDIGTLAGNAIAAIHDKSENHGMLEGAKVLSKDVFEQVLSYLIEVRCAASNLKAAKELCEKTNYDLECQLFENVTTSEDCIANVSNQWFGWSDDSIISKTDDDDRTDLNVDDIFTSSQISGKNIQYVLGSIAVEKDDTKRKALIEKLKNAVVETFNWEASQENFSDLPVLHFIGRTTQIMETLTKNTAYYGRVCEAISSINAGITSALEDGSAVPCTFNPTPTINAITPLPVEARASQVMFNNIYRAETDEELDKAMLEFAKCFPTEKLFFRKRNNNPKSEERKIPIDKKLIDAEQKKVISKMKPIINKANSDKKMKDIFAENLNDYIKTDPELYDTDPKTIKMPNLKSSDIEILDSDGDGNLVIFTMCENIPECVMLALSHVGDKMIEILEDDKTIDFGIIDSIYVEDDQYKNFRFMICVKFKEFVTEPVTESNAISKGARSASRSIQKGSEKAIRNVGGTAHEVKQAAHNAIDPMEKYIGQMMEKLKKADSAQRREILVKGGVMPKVLRWVKRSIPLIAGAAVGTVVPAAAVISGISLIGFIASDKYLDAKEKRKILREIEDEIEIVNEKIDDSRGDNNKQKKYELIRIRNNLKRTQDRILYNLKE